MSDYLLEIGTEEIPAGFMESALEDLKDKMALALKEARVEYTSIKTLGTPRRMVLILGGIRETTNSLEVENRGPKEEMAFKDGVPTKALLGFLKGQGALLDDISIKELKGVKYVFVLKKEVGQESKIVLGKIVPEVLGALRFPKMMKWGVGENSFVRPIKYLLSMWNQEQLEIEFLGVKSGNTARGHRFLSRELVTISSAIEEDYLEKLQDASVVVDQHQREKSILEGIQDLEAGRKGLKVVVDQELLKEVTHLVEFPTVFLGKFKEEYLELPQEVLMITMKNHQKYFPVVDDKGKLLPYFVGVRCGNSEFLESVVAGNEKVLTARFEDANFFYREDQKTTLIEQRNKLKHVVFQESLGSVFDKVLRVERLAIKIGEKLQYKKEELEIIAQVAALCKSDLATQMVYEMPEVEGIIGSYYASLEGYGPLVGKGIVEHYLPSFAGESVPETPGGICTALADKLDTIVSIFGVGLIPSGSQDPYALRRKALGIVRIIIENKLNISLDELLELTYGELGDLVTKDEKENIKGFFKLRVKGVLEKEGLNYQLVDSLLNNGFDNLYEVFLKGLDLLKFSKSAGFDDLVEVLKRSKNIIKDFSQRDFREELIILPEEEALNKEFKEVSLVCQKDLAAKNYLTAMENLLALKVPLDNFFKEVMVNVEDIAVKNNRLSLLGSIVDLGENLFDVNFL